MQEHSDWYRLFSNYWWLLFPLCWGIGALLKNIFRHHRATDALTLIKTYADQGKEPPPELLAVLRMPEQAETRRSGLNFSTYGWILVFLFGSSACGIALMAVYPPDPVARIPMLMGAITCAGLALGFLVAMQAHKKQDRNPPQ